MTFPKTFLFFLLMPLFLQNTLNADAERNIKKARVENSEPTLKCGPSESEGVITPSKLPGELKKGMTILLMPGKYEYDEIGINTDKVVITGEPGRYCDVKVVVSGKDCVIKNLWVREIRSEGNTVFIDSIVSNFVTEKSDTAEIVFDNCCIGTTNICAPGKKLVYRNCTLCATEELFSANGGDFDFGKCILYSRNLLFRLESGGNKVKIAIANSVAFAKNNFAADRDMKMIAGKSGDVKKSKLLCTLVMKKVLEEKPILKLEMGESDKDLAGWWPGNVHPRNFVLLDDSPGKKDGFGAKLSEDGFPASVKEK